MHYSLGFLTLGGFLMGIVFWGGFNTALELTNTETFCTGCHEMRDNVFQEFIAEFVRALGFAGVLVLDDALDDAIAWPSHGHNR